MVILLFNFKVVLVRVAGWSKLVVPARLASWPKILGMPAIRYRTPPHTPRSLTADRQKNKKNPSLGIGCEES